MSTLVKPHSNWPKVRFWSWCGTSGGNDALNMVAPIHHAVYRTSRPNIALDRSASHDLGKHDGLDLALHPKCKELMAAWQAEDLWQSYPGLATQSLIAATSAPLIFASVLAARAKNKLAKADQSGPTTMRSSAVKVLPTRCYSGIAA